VGDEATTVVLVRLVVVRDEIASSVVVGWVPNVGDELETAVILVREVVVEDELGLTVVTLLIVRVGVELLEISSIVPYGPVEETVQCS
jgi:hypothetical protein